MSIGEIVIITILIAEWLWVAWRGYRVDRARQRRLDALTNVTREQWRKAVEDAALARERDGAQAQGGIGHGA